VLRTPEGRKGGGSSRRGTVTELVYKKKGGEGKFVVASVVAGGRFSVVRRRTGKV